jgi:hypothetical protein
MVLCTVDVILLTARCLWFVASRSAGLLRERLRQCGETFKAEVVNFSKLQKYGKELKQNLIKQDAALRDMLKKAVAAVEGVQEVRGLQQWWSL